MELSKEKIREIIARRIAAEFKEGDAITLGIGLPTEAANYLPESVHILLQSENGIIGVGAHATDETIDCRISNAGGKLVTINPGGAYFDSFLSFGMIRGGHINATVLGGLQVDQDGNLANWMVPGKMVPGMGGAMDLVVGAQKVIVAMEHTAKGAPKILKKCTLPLTAANEVDLIITEKGVIEVTAKGLVLREVTNLSSIEDIKASTEAELIVPNNLKFVDVV